MPACGQAVRCGVCDTPELWCGAAGLCARVRASAGAAESLHTYIHAYIYHIHLYLNNIKIIVVLLMYRRFYDIDAASAAPMAKDGAS